MNRLIDMQSERAAHFYEKLSPFLRSIPAHIDEEYGAVPTSMDKFKEFANGQRGNGESPEQDIIRVSAPNIFGHCSIIVWGPDDKSNRKPTFHEFVNAYGMAEGPVK